MLTKHIQHTAIAGSFLLTLHTGSALAQTVQDEVLVEIGQIKVEINRLKALHTYQLALEARLDVDGANALESASFPRTLCKDIESICALLPLSTQTNSEVLQ